MSVVIGLVFLVLAGVSALAGIRNIGFIRFSAFLLVVLATLMGMSLLYYASIGVRFLG